jgi:hypothetical protein
MEKNMANNDVFISYRRKDLDFVTQLHQELTNRSISAWFDMENIEVADHWRSSIAEGIRACKVFVLVLSPDAVESVNIRKEVDLAETHGKKIVPLMWRQTEIPVAFEYSLAGLQWIDFKQTASVENFDQLADVINRLLGGSSMAEATSNKQVAQAPAIPAIDKGKAQPAADDGQKIGGPRKLGGLKKKQTVSPIALGGMVISGVVTTFGLGVEEQDYVNGELKWLFSATDHFLKIRQGNVERSQPVPVPIPADAERIASANNQLLSNIDDFDLQLWEGQIESGYKRIDTYLKNLNILLDQEAFKGEVGKGDVYLQNQIKAARIEIVKILQEEAQLMNQAYGVLVTSPDQLMEFLA